MSRPASDPLVPRGSALVRPALRRIWKRLLWWRFLLFQRGRYDRLVLERPAGSPILVLPGVFNPELLSSGAFFARQLERGLIPDGAEVLDMGCGSGIGAVVAARSAGGVVAADINPAAVRCARINALIHGVEERVEAVESDLFSALEGRRFDAVLFNPPFYRGQPERPLDHAWRSPDTIERFAADLPSHLTAGGFALVVFSTDGDLEGLLRAFAAENLDVELLAESERINEVLVLYRVRPRGGGAVGG